MTVSEFLKEVTIVLTTYKRPVALRYMVRHIKHRPLSVVVDRNRISCDIPVRKVDFDIVVAEPNCGAVKAFHTGVLAAATKYIIWLNDDMRIHGKNDAWLYEAARVYVEKLGDKDGVVALNECVTGGKLACFPLISRKFYMEYFNPPPYRAFGIDNEWTAKAQYLKVYAYAKHAIVKHLQWIPADRKILHSDLTIFRRRMKVWLSEQERTNL